MSHSTPERPSRGADSHVTERGRSERPPAAPALWVGAALFLGLLGLYAWTAAPEVTFHDAGELITGAWTLGIPHPPGAPTWCLLGHLFAKLPLGSPAFRLNLMSGFFGAMTCVLVYWLALRMAVRRRGMPARWPSHAAGLTAALLLAQAPGFWSKCVQAELYTLNTAFMMLILCLFDGWCADVTPEETSGRTPRHRRRWLLWIALLFGLGAGNYLGLLYYAPILGAAVLILRPATFREAKLLAGAAMLFLAGFAIHLYLPIRSLANPPIDWGNPETLPAFLGVMSRDWWGKLSFANVSWPFVAHYIATFAFLDNFGVAGLALAGIGLFFAARRRPPLTAVLVLCFYVYAAAMTLMMATTPALTDNLVFVTTYDLQEIHIPMYTILAVFAGLGFGALLDACLRDSDADRPGQTDPPAARGRRPAVARRAFAAAALTGLMAGVVADRFASQFPRCNCHSFTQPYAYGQALLDAVPRDAWVVVFPGSDNAVFILGYLKYCEGLRDDVRLITPSPSYEARLTALAADTNAPLTSATAVAVMRDHLSEYLLPVFTPRGVAGTNRPPVIFANLPAAPELARQATPCGLVFRLDGGSGGDEAQQMRFWKHTLRSPAFALQADSKPNFRENMMQMLNDHAWWHELRGEPDAAAYLYLQAVRYAPAPRPDLMAAAADSLLALGRVDEAIDEASQAIGDDADNPRAYTVLGIALARQRRFVLSADCFRAILRRHPDDAAARANLDLSLRRAAQAR